MLCLISSVIVTPLLVVIVMMLAQEAMVRWRYRNIPGPPAALFTGNLSAFLRTGILAAMDGWAGQYGPLFRFRLMARTFVVVADPDAARSALYKLTNHAPLANPVVHLLPPDLRGMEGAGLLMAKDEEWRMLRTAWQPAFSPASLAGYQALMDQEAAATAERLAARAEGAEEGGGGAGGAADPRGFDLVPEICRMTLAVVGSTAYGVDFNSPEYSGDGDSQTPTAPTPTATTATPSLSLAAACRDWFRTMSPRCRTRWALATALPPPLLPGARRLAVAFPDGVLARHIEARRVLRDTSARLIGGWKASRGDAAAAAAGTGSASPGKGGGGGGLAPGSFLALMLGARARGSGKGLTDMQLEAQVQTFILGGFETTAMALCFALYLLASHPEAAAALEAELDAVVPRDGAPLTLEDLDKLVYTEAVIQEALRLYPPAHATSRLTDKPMQILGHAIPAGSTLFIPIAHLQRSTALWPQPEAFVPERFLPPAHPRAAASASPCAATHPHAHLPFGGGTRMCVGWRFAMQEAKTALARVCSGLRFELVPGQVPLPLAAGLTLSPRNGVWVRATRRCG